MAYAPADTSVKAIALLQSAVPWIVAAAVAKAVGTGLVAKTSVAYPLFVARRVTVKILPTPSA